MACTVVWRDTRLTVRVTTVLMAVSVQPVISSMDTNVYSVICVGVTGHKPEMTILLEPYSALVVKNGTYFRCLLVIGLFKHFCLICSNTW